MEGPRYSLNDLKAVQDWVLARQLKTKDIEKVVVTQYHGNPILVAHIAKIDDFQKSKIFLLGSRSGYLTSAPSSSM
jgi:hypothetical protein